MLKEHKNFDNVTIGEVTEYLEDNYKIWRNRQTSYNHSGLIVEHNSYFSKISVGLFRKAIRVLHTLLKDREEDFFNKTKEMLDKPGIICEIIGIYWLKKISIDYPPTLFSDEDVSSENKVTLDGKFEGSFLFDIKSFRTMSEVLTDQMNNLNKKHPEYLFNYSGKVDVAREGSLENLLVGIEKALRKGKNEFSNQAGSIIAEKSEFSIQESVFNPWSWCENNYKSFLGDCHQFSKSDSFVLIQVFDAKNDLHLDSPNIETSIVLRTLVRRTFFALNNSSEKAKSYDKKYDNAEDTVGSTIKNLSGLFFIELNSGACYVYLNPFANQKIKSNIFETFHHNAIAQKRKYFYDDFEHDNY